MPDDADQLSRGLEAAVAAAAQRDAAVVNTRSWVVAFGRELASLIAMLPRTQVEALGLGVRIALRGPPTVEDAGD